MPDDVYTTHLEERRCEHRNELDQLYSVELNPGRPIPIYQLKLRDISGCIQSRSFSESEACCGYFVYRCHF